MLTRGPNARRILELIKHYKDQSAGGGSGRFTAPVKNRGVLVGSPRNNFSQVGKLNSASVAKVRQRPQKPKMEMLRQITGPPTP